MIKLQNLTFGYRRHKKLFTSLQLELPAGNIYGLLGKNGVGKTTLLKLIAGMLFPEATSCEVYGDRPGDRHPRFLEKIYILPEEFYLPAITIGRYVSIYSSFYPKFDPTAFAGYLAEFDLPAKVNLSGISYGEKKKFLVAFGLATGCELLLLDEPTNGLDIQSKSKFRQIVAASLTEARTFIISTHQVRDLQNLIDPIIILDDGQVLLNKSIDEITHSLVFEMCPALPDDANILYSEKKLNGYVIARENMDQSETSVDLEILFNTVMTNRNAIARIFSKGESQ